MTISLEAVAVEAAAYLPSIMLKLPVVVLDPAELPIATLLAPLVIPDNDEPPIPTLFAAVPNPVELPPKPARVPR